MSPDINCIIIDDEPKAIDLLEKRLAVLFPALHIAGKYTQWKDGMEAIRENAPDILFLDISMPEKSGIDFLKLFPSIPFQVIFITAHSEFALQAIKFSAAGYVLKPIDDYELSFAVNKALERIKDKPAAKEPVTQTNNNHNHNARKIGIPNIKGVDYLNPDDILYFESVNKYTKVVTKNYSIMSSYNLGAYRKILDEQVFYSVHRSYIANMNHIKSYQTSGMLIMDDNMQIPVARSVRADFLSVFNQISRTARKETDN